MTIDIKPGSYPNALNLKAVNEIVTVAVLGSVSFNVNSIVILPLSSAPKFGGSTPQAPVHIAYQDVNLDGFTDLVLQYNLGGLGFSATSTQGCVTGTLIGGVPFLGCDSVMIVNS